jgi:predicted transcriptional regulator of viral defense system
MHAQAWALAARQHGVITRAQLYALGFTKHAVDHRIATGRLHPSWAGVFAVGRPQLTREGRWMAAVLRCGEGAALSHEDAGALYAICDRGSGSIHISIPRRSPRRPPGLSVHRRTGPLAAEVTVERGIPVTTPICTLIDLATRLPRHRLEAAVNEADKRDLVDAETLRAMLDRLPGVAGVRVLRRLLDRLTFRLTDSELERRFLCLVADAGLPPPQTGIWLSGFKVDFFWPELGLVVETDGLRYHRTPAEQARDRRRDQAHVAAGLTPLRFTHAQVRYEAAHVRRTLTATARRLANDG